MNFYASSMSQKLFYQSKEKSMLDKCLLASNEISNLEVINAESVEGIVSQLGSTRILITDPFCQIIYDNQGCINSFAVFPEIVEALECNDVFSWQYHDGAMHSHAAVPIITSGTVSGCIYLMEQDVSQGALLRTLLNTVLRITVILELVVILFSLTYSNTFSSRLRQIMSSMRIIQQGDYSHKVKLGGNDELTFLGDEFNDLTDKLQISEEKRSRFVSDASHELKTPLASIKLLTDSILQNNMDADTMREFVEDIGNEADRLNRTTEKLLSLTRVDGQPNTVAEIIHIPPTIDRVTRMLSPLAKKNDITISVDVLEDSPVLIAEDDLYQIVFNLVENGIKYNIPGGMLRISLYRSDDNEILEISDTGVGIPQESLEHIFERFYRVDKARSRATGGSGLGLSIVKAIVRRNRGDISVDSTAGKGSRFTVTFPVFDIEETTN